MNYVPKLKYCHMMMIGLEMNSILLAVLSAVLILIIIGLLIYIKFLLGRLDATEQTLRFYKRTIDQFSKYLEDYSETRSR